MFLGENKNKKKLIKQPDKNQKKKNKVFKRKQQDGINKDKKEINELIKNFFLWKKSVVKP